MNWEEAFRVMPDVATSAVQRLWDRHEALKEMATAADEHLARAQNQFGASQHSAGVLSLQYARTLLHRIAQVAKDEEPE